MKIKIPTMRALADDEAPDSFSNRMRAKRFERFESLTSSLPRPLKILDIGGTNVFWERRGWAGRPDVHIVIVNLSIEKKLYTNITPTVGNATDLREYSDKSFDVAFSNSVIEHLFTIENQRRMAAEVRRVAKAFWIQTPNFWFPMEPHFLVPGWQWMPASLRVAILRRRRCGSTGRCRDLGRARQIVREVRLMTRRELFTMFPGASIEPERFAGLVKSWVVHGGFDDFQEMKRNINRPPIGDSK